MNCGSYMICGLEFNYHPWSLTTESQLHKGLRRFYWKWRCVLWLCRIWTLFAQMFVFAVLGFSKCKSLYLNERENVTGDKYTHLIRIWRGRIAGKRWLPAKEGSVICPPLTNTCVRWSVLVSLQYWRRSLSLYPPRPRVTLCAFRFLRR